MRTQPPAWAEAVLRILLSPDMFLSVSGDLLEQYRDSILPDRGQVLADRWYMRQVLGFTLRKTLPWAGSFAFAFWARGIFDALLPVTDFYVRSIVITYTLIGLLLASGFWAARRSGSFLAGAAAGLATVVPAVVLNMGMNVMFLAFWHDARVMNSIAASGGLEDMFLLPAILIAPGLVLGGIGGLAGAGTKRLSQNHRKPT